MTRYCPGEKIELGTITILWLSERTLGVRGASRYLNRDGNRELRISSESDLAERDQKRLLIRTVF